MTKLRALWVDQTVSVKEGESARPFGRNFETIYCADARQIDGVLRQQEVDVLCFDFDYPDRTGLRAVRDAKAAYPSLPVVMLTLQHSEALAVWAFRAKVWDYLVKPVPKREADRCLSTLFLAMSHRKKQQTRTVAARTDRIPEEIAFLPKSESSSLAAALYFVEQHFRSKVRSEEVAELCGMSPFRFSRAFRETYGVTFRDYLIGYRLKEACRLLANPSASIADVAFAVGFTDPSYFARIFKQRIGKAPSELIGRTLESALVGDDVPVSPPLTVL